MPHVARERELRRQIDLAAHPLPRKSENSAQNSEIQPRAARVDFDERRPVTKRAGEAPARTFEPHVRELELVARDEDVPGARVDARTVARDGNVNVVEARPSSTLTRAEASTLVPRAPSHFVVTASSRAARSHAH